MEPRLHAIKLVYDNGIIEDVAEGIVIIKNNESLEFEAVNVLPIDQLLLSAITLHSLFEEYISEGGTELKIEGGLEDLLVEFIRVLLDLQHKTNDKGDVLQ